MHLTTLIPVQAVARYYQLDTPAFVRGIERGCLQAERRADGYYTSVAWVEQARARAAARRGE